MKGSSVGSALIFFFSSISVFAQVDTTWITDQFHEVDIDLSAYKLVEGKTFTYRESSPGVKTDNYFDMTSWDSSPFTQGYLARSWGEYILNYRLLTPLSYTPSYAEGFPLLIMMHGAGERGNCWNGNCYWGNTSIPWNANSNVANPPFPSIPTTSASPAVAYNQDGTLWTSSTKYYPVQVLNNDHSMTHGGSTELTARNLAGTKLPNDPTLPSRAFPGFVLHAQSLNGWSGDERNVVRIVRLLTKKYKIDQNRIYVHGLSNGGQGVYQVVKVAPWLIAGALPMSAVDDRSIIEDVPKNYVDRIANVPIWQFQGGTDTSPTPGRSAYYINTFLSRGLDAKLTLYPSLGHGVWNNAYAEPNFWSWMLGHNKSDIHVMYGNTSICATSGAGVELRLAYGFLGYQWERDGALIPGANAAIYTATIPGTYRTRFSRITNPTEVQWNKWSKPVVVTENNLAAPIITADGSTHMPGINGETSVMVTGPANEKYYYWYKNGVKITDTNPLPPFNTLKDTLVYRTISQSGGAGTYALETANKQNCKTPRSQNLVVCSGCPISLSPPSNISGVVTSPSSINLFWTDNSNNETNFEVYRARQGNVLYKFVGITDADVVSFLDTGLEPNVAYNYKLRAINNTAESPYTAAFLVSSAVDTQAPTPPQNLRIVKEDINSITVQWNPSTDDSGINNYIISYAGATGYLGAIGASAPTAGTQTIFTINGLTRNAIYNISVRAVDRAVPSNTSAASNVIQAETVKKGLDYTHSEGAWTTLYTGQGVNSVNYGKVEYTGTTSTVTIAPRVQDDFFYFRFEGYINIPAGQSGDHQFELTNKEGAAVFIGTNGFNTGLNYVDNPDKVVNNDGIKQSGIPTTQYGSKNLTAAAVTGTAYRFSAIFFEYTGANETLDLRWDLPDGGTSYVPIPASAFRSGPILIPPTPPAAPTTLVATTGGQSSINLTWTSAAATFEIYRSLALAGTYEIVSQTTNTNFNDIGLNPGTAYYYKVKATTASGFSAFSNAANATTTPDVTAPSIPAGLQLLTQTYTSAGLTWTASTDNVKVTLYRIYANNILIGTSIINTYTATDLLPNTNYNFEVSAVDASSNESARSTPVPFATNVPDIYYYDGSGNLNDVTNWGKAANGSGDHPPSFNINGQYFNVTSTAVVPSTWTVGGSVSKVIVKAGTTLSINNPMTGNLDVEAGAVVNVGNVIMPVFTSIDPTSTINFNTYTNIPKANYGNVNLNGSGVKNLETGITSVAGNLNVNNGITLKGLPGNASSINVQGNLIINGSLTEPAADNNITITFSGSNPGIISTNGNLGLYELVTGPNKDLTFTNTLGIGSPVNIRLGSSNGGGLTLNNGSVFRVANNNLVLRLGAKVNGASETGRIHIAGGDIDFTSNTNTNSLFNFHPSANNVDYFNLDLTGTAIATIGETALITDGIKIKRGVLNANGKIILESNATGTASIRQIENGSIQGNVTVKRYAAAHGKVYRYFSIPVAGVKVADLQQYMDVTGRFVGATRQTNNSLFKYNEPLGGWLGFPADGGSNQETFTKGTGYSAYYFNGTSPVTYEVSGSPHQGDVVFASLTGGTGAPGNGWNLLGNPYASPIVWGNAGWTTSNVSNTVYVRYNVSPTQFEYRYWSTANGGTGTLTGGKIPAGQSFWVQATTASPTVTIREAGKSNDTGTSNTDFFRESSSLEFGNFEITLSNGVNLDPAFIIISPTGQDGFNKGIDAEKRANSSLNLSTYSTDSVNLAINILSNSFCSKTVGLNLQDVAPGNYTLSLKQEDWGGAILLQDHFTNSTFDLSNGSEYSFSVTTHLNSYGKNRFKIQIGNPAVDISNTAVNLSSAGICEGEAAKAIFTNTQKGVSYSIANENGTRIVDSQIGNGDSLSVSIPGLALNQGNNNLKFYAEWNGCLSLELPVRKQLNYSKPPEVIIPQAFMTSCSDEVVTLLAEGAPEGGSYQWFEESAGNPLKGQTSGTVTLSSVNNPTLFMVRSVNAYGCVSEFKGIHVEPVTLERPTITESDNILYSSVEENVQWFRDNQIIPGATNSYLEETVPGIYTVQSSLSGCTKTSGGFTYSITGIENKLSDGTYLTVYPNPTSPDKINLKGYVHAAEIVNILLVDIHGKTLLTLPMTSQEISEGTALNTSELSLASGLYFIYLQKGKTIIRSKVMIR